MPNTISEILPYVGFAMIAGPLALLFGMMVFDELQQWHKNGELLFRTGFFIFRLLVVAAFFGWIALAARLMAGSAF